MLIVAMPKSASSALAAALVRHHGLADRTNAVRQAYFGALPRHGRFPRLTTQHFEIGRTLNDTVAAEAARSETLVKYHIAPIDQHQALLRDVPKVVLVRRPEDVVRAYRRVEITGKYKRRNLDFVFCRSEAEWLDRAQRCGFLGELALFNEQWRYHGGTKLIVDHEELVQAPTATLNRIEVYFGLPASAEADLPQQKYTRRATADQDSEPGRLRLYWQRRKRIVRRLNRDLRWTLTGRQRL